MREAITVTDLRGAVKRGFQSLDCYGLVMGVEVQVDDDDLVWHIDLRVVEDRGVICQKCGRRTIPESPPRRPEIYQCGACQGNREATRRELIKRQGGRCIVSGCNYDEVSGERRLDIHRVVPGRMLGSYHPDNCVLVCRHHHPVIEGLSWGEINNYQCTDGQRRRIKEAERKQQVSIEELKQSHFLNEHASNQEKPFDFFKSVSRYIEELTGSENF